MKSGSKKFLRLFVEFPSPLAFVLNVIRLLTLSFGKENFSKESREREAWELLPVSGLSF